MTEGGRPIALAILRASARVVGRHALALAALALVASGIPLALLFALAAALQAGALPGDFDAGMDRGGVVLLALWGALTVVQVGALTSGTLRAVRGEPFGVRAALAAGVARAPAVLAAALVTAAASLGGAVALVVPGAAALGAMGAAVPVAVGEAAGPARALGRSLELTRGDRAGVFAALAAAAVATGAAGWYPVYALRGEPPWILLVPGWLSLVVPLPAVVAAAAYAELSARKDAPRRAELERVFA